MTPLFEQLKSLFTPAPMRQDFDVSYLAHAVDIYDLEWRMQKLDGRDRDPWAALSLALASR